MARPRLVEGLEEQLHPAQICLDLPLLFGPKYVIIILLLQKDLAFIQMRGLLFITPILQPAMRCIVYRNRTICYIVLDSETIYRIVPKK